MYHANQRQGTAKVKTRAEVHGSHGSPGSRSTPVARAPATRSRRIWRKGGTIFGPHPRDFSYHMPRTAKPRRAAARRSSASWRTAKSSSRRCPGFARPRPRRPAAARGSRCAAPRADPPGRGRRERVEVVPQLPGRDGRDGRARPVRPRRHQRRPVHRRALGPRPRSRAAWVRTRPEVPRDATRTALPGRQKSARLRRRRPTTAQAQRLPLPRPGHGQQGRDPRGRSRSSSRSR